MLHLTTLGQLAVRRDGAGSEPLALQSKRLGLLAYLALGSLEAGFQRRDVLLALFWPEHSHAAGRHALRHALYDLRNALGDGILLSRTNEEVGVAAGLRCDARALEEAYQAGRPEEALALYRGDFLAGVFITGCSPEWEEWVSHVRARLRARAAWAAWAVSEFACSAGNMETALDAARRGRELDPDDEVGLRRLMCLLSRFGRRASALRLYEDFVRKMRREYRAEPSHETWALAEQIRLGGPERISQPAKEAVSYAT